ncbi:MAG: carbon starvation CstA 5TM domain-containing protein [Chloroflexota bacterium]|nr:carbon starvation CstA 5TM domain-containing protein [Chloroflexota bacterium]
MPELRLAYEAAQVGIAFIVLGAPMTWPAVTSFSAKAIGGLPSPFWPTVPLVIACGALSGFHSIVASGTTSKMLDTEAHALRIGYGGMLTEGFLSTIVVVAMGAFGLSFMVSDGGFASTSAAAAAVSSGLGAWNVPKLALFTTGYAQGVNAVFRIPIAIGALFASLWVCCFALTTLDTTNRIGRFAWVDILTRAVPSETARKNPVFKFFTFKWVAAAIAAGVGMWLATSGGVFSALWAAFGAANQMLASLALMVTAVWVTNVLRPGKGKCLCALIPAGFLWITVMAAGIWFIAVKAGSGATMGIVGVQLVLAIYLLYEVITALKKGPAKK